MHTASIGMSPSHFVTRIFGFFICDLPSVFLCRENWHSLAGYLPSDYVRFPNKFTFCGPSSVVIADGNCWGCPRKLQSSRDALDCRKVEPEVPVIVVLAEDDFTPRTGDSVAELIAVAPLFKN